MDAHETRLTAKEVNQRLPLVRAIVRDIVSLSSDVTERKSRLGDLRRSYPPGDRAVSSFEEEVRQMESELQRDERRLAEYQAELSRVGGVLTCAVTGTVDFASEFDGGRIWLCWRLGEPEVMYWHQFDCGNDRMLLDEQAASLATDGSDPGFATEGDGAES